MIKDVNLINMREEKEDIYFELAISQKETFLEIINYIDVLEIIGEVHQERYYLNLDNLKIEDDKLIFSIRKKHVEKIPNDSYQLILNLKEHKADIHIQIDLEKVLLCYSKESQILFEATKNNFHLLHTNDDNLVNLIDKLFIKEINTGIPTISFYIEDTVEGLNIHKGRLLFINERTKDSVEVYRETQGIYHINLNEKGFYTGKWEGYYICEIAGTEYRIPLKSCEYTDIEQKNYFQKDTQLFQTAIRNQWKHLSLDIEGVIKPEDLLSSFHITYLNVKENILHIDGKINADANVDVMQDIAVVGIVVKHRQTNLKKYYQVNNFMNGCFSTKLNLEDINFLEQNGHLDINFVCKLRDTVQFEDTFQMDYSLSTFVSVPKTIINKDNIIRTIEFYINEQGGLSALIENNAIVSHIKRVDFYDGEVKIKGFMLASDVPIHLVNIHLINEEGIIYTPNVIIQKEENKFIFDISIKLEQLVERGMFYKASITYELKYGERDVLVKLQSNYDDILQKEKTVPYPAEIYNGYKGELKYNSFNELEMSFLPNVSCTCKSVSKKKGAIHCVVEVDTQVENIKLRAWDKESEQSYLSISGTVINNKQYEFVIKPKDIIGSDNLIEVSMNVCIEVEKMGDIFLIPLTLTKIKENRIINAKRFISNAVKLNRDSYYSIYYQPQDRERIARLEIRNLYANERISERMKLKMAQGIAFMLSKFMKKPIWLIGENLGEMAQDNGLAFFEYCINHRNKSEKAYYVTTKNNKNYQNLVNYKDHLVTYDSFKHYILYHLAEYLIVSHGIRDVIPSVRHRAMGTNPKDIIYLQHGIIAMKKLYFNSRSYNGRIKKFVVSSEFEKSILINEMKFRPHQVMVTGIARYDKLKNQSQLEEQRNILIMPTWREWALNTEKEFINSDFYRKYSSLLHNHELIQLMEKENITINFYAHIEIQRKYLHLFKNTGRVNIIDASKANIKELMEKASLMITDYSSVAFDFNYMQKPVIFYQFDLEDYLCHRGSYIDMEKELYGDVIFEEKKLLDCIKGFIKEDFRYKKEMIQKSEKYYIDNKGLKNSERIYNEIKRLSRTK